MIFDGGGITPPGILHHCIRGSLPYKYLPMGLSSVILSNKYVFFPSFGPIWDLDRTIGQTLRSTNGSSRQGIATYHHINQTDPTGYI